MPIPTIQRSWVEVGGNPALSSNLVNYANLVNNLETTWAKCRCAILRIVGRGGPAVAASETGVHTIPPMAVSFKPPASGIVAYPIYTHSITFPSAWENAKLFRCKGWPRLVFFEGWDGFAGFFGPIAYTFYNPSQGGTDPLRLFLEAYNVPPDPYYNNNTMESVPNPFGAYSGLDDSEVQAYWVGATIETSVGNYSLTYDALDTDPNTNQNTGTQISYGTNVIINKVNI